MVRKGLGKGLGALIETANQDDGIGLVELKINEIEPNTHQPRKNFDDEKLIQLSESIKEYGIVQPIIVRKENDTYRIVAGERRWRAARLAGLNVVPVVIKDISNRQLMEIALIENIQREDLNPIEEAEAFDRLLKEFNMTQEELSKAVGKSRSAIANSIRLMSLCEEIKNFVVNGDLSNGHARTLIVIENKEMQKQIAAEIIEKGLNVRQTEILVKRLLSNKPKEKSTFKDENFIEIEDRLKGIFGTKVQLVSNNKKGKILIEYYSNDELQRILDLVDIIGKK